MNNEQTLAVPPNIPHVTSHPRDCWLRILMHGLFIGAWGETGGRKYLEIGALYPSPARHHLSLRLINRTTGAEITIPYNETSLIEVEVTGGEIPIHRCGPKGSRGQYDWDGVADFEAVDLYGSHCKKIPAKLKPRLRIYNGVAFTALRSPLLEKKVASAAKQNFGPIGLLMAVGIERGDEAIIRVGAWEKRIQRTDKWNLVYRNDCMNDCDIPPAPQTLSDFNHLFHAFAPPIGSSHSIEIYTHTHFNAADELNRLRAERRAVVAGTGDSEYEYLKGIHDVLKLEVAEEKIRPDATRYDPCGMGFFGDGNGLDG